nr:DDE-type integrase/transposase/recombinase [uncultured Roseobacter sp.]
MSLVGWVLSQTPSRSPIRLEVVVGDLNAMNDALWRVDSSLRIRIYRSKYTNNIAEQNHRGPKRRTRPMMTFRSFRSASATLDGIETEHMIRKGKLGRGCPFAVYASLAV